MEKEKKELSESRCICHSCRLAVPFTTRDFSFTVIEETAHLDCLLEL